MVQHIKYIHLHQVEVLRLLLLAHYNTWLWQAVAQAAVGQVAAAAQVAFWQVLHRCQLVRMQLW
jgi:hypothetical protein